jgi:glutamyl-tRNA synthetase
LNESRGILLKKVRVRFAPSPTGHLHIGGARTALFNWLFARQQGGVFILRIEDTDRSRSTDEYIESIIEGMKWLGLHWDEGPFRQTDRFDVYKKGVDSLIAGGMAYYCYCTAEELEQRRHAALSVGKQPKYDGRCRELKSPVTGIVPSVRFKMPAEGTVFVEDMIRGRIEFENSQLDDLIIMRSDGTPTYNFVVVMDDVDMGITHVIRGDDHLNNTPKQIHIYKALGHKMPLFAHLPMILGSDKARFSKRHGASSVTAYRDMGYLPDALVNYLVRLGWSYGDQEVFGREELIRHFSFDSVGKSPSVFNPDKLIWLNAEYIKKTPVDKLAELVMPFLISDGTIKEGDDTGILKKAIPTLIERCRTLVELAGSLRYYLTEYVEMEPKAKEKFINETTLPYLKEIRDGLSSLKDFGAEEIERVFLSVKDKFGVKLGNIAQPVRVAMTGKTESPGIFEVLDVLGREKSIKRLDKAISMIKKEGA